MWFSDIFIKNAQFAFQVFALFFAAEGVEEVGSSQSPAGKEETRGRLLVPAQPILLLDIVLLIVKLRCSIKRGW